MAVYQRVAASLSSVQTMIMMMMMAAATLD